MPPEPEADTTMDEAIQLAMLEAGARRRARRFWVMLAFIPALLVPFVLAYAVGEGLKPLPAGVTRWTDVLLSFTAVLAPLWIIFCVWRVMTHALPGSEERTPRPRLRVVLSAHAGKLRRRPRRGLWLLRGAIHFLQMSPAPEQFPPKHWPNSLGSRSLRHCCMLFLRLLFMVLAALAFFVAAIWGVYYLISPPDL